MAHLIFVVKYRKKLLNQYGEEIKSIFVNISKVYAFEILESEVDQDHIHILIRYPPTKSILEIVRLLKQISTYSIWRQNNNSLNLQKYFWKKRVFWSSGYFACSIGNVSKETIEKYIQNQG